MIQQIHLLGKCLILLPKKIILIDWIIIVTSNSRQMVNTSWQQLLTTLLNYGTTARAAVWSNTPAIKIRNIVFSRIFPSLEANGSCLDQKITRNGFTFTNSETPILLNKSRFSTCVIGFMARLLYGLLRLLPPIITRRTINQLQSLINRRKGDQKYCACPRQFLFCNPYTIAG